MLPKIRPKNRKGVSIMIGYVLLVAIAITLGAVTYSWLKTYIPKGNIECPDGVSIFIKNYSCEAGMLNITLKNNGRFNITGYLIRAGNSTDQFATKDLSRNVTSGELNASNAVIYITGKNSLAPGIEKTSTFSITDPTFDSIKIIEIVPARFENDGNRERFVTCANAIVRNELSSCVVG